jgi:hypothetical protein
MRRLLVVVSASLLAVSTETSHAADGSVLEPVNSSGVEKEPGFLSRDGMFGVGLGLNLAITSLVAGELLAGNNNLALDAMAMVGGVPVVAYMAAYARADTSDRAMAVMAIWGGALLIKNTYEVIRHHTNAEDLRVPSRPMFRPIQVPVPREVSVAPMVTGDMAGLAVSGTY